MIRILFSDEKMRPNRREKYPEEIVLLQKIERSHRDKLRSFPLSRYLRQIIRLAKRDGLPMTPPVTKETEQIRVRVLVAARMVKSLLRVGHLIPIFSSMFALLASIYNRCIIREEQENTQQNNQLADLLGMPVTRT